jgi:hypothetical protein
MEDVVLPKPSKEEVVASDLKTATEQTAAELKAVTADHAFELARLVTSTAAELKIESVRLAEVVKSSADHNTELIGMLTAASVREAEILRGRTFWFILLTVLQIFMIIAIAALMTVVLLHR